ncbi:hypothetical protein J6590_067189 [Homalodisca vitripennis]|nr:hypothetical protein J6590_067189 [Homalodisca vitripennis]
MAEIGKGDDGDLCSAQDSQNRKTDEKKLHHRNCLTSGTTSNTRFNNNIFGDSHAKGLSSIIQKKIKDGDSVFACANSGAHVTRFFRRLFTRHGQHLNGQGKAALCYKLLSAIESLRREQCESSSNAATANQQLTQLNGVPHNNFVREMPLPVGRPEPEPVTLPFDTYADAVRSDNLRLTLTSERHQPEPSPPAAARDVGSGDPDSVIADRRMSIESKNRSFIIIGDFNVDVINVTDMKTRKLGDLLKTFDLHWSVNSPTRVTVTTATAIDNVITNMPSVAVSLIVTAISDHDAQLVTLTDFAHATLPPQTVVSRATRPENIAAFYVAVKSGNVPLLSSDSSRGSCSPAASMMLRVRWLR